MCKEFKVMKTMLHPYISVCLASIDKQVNYRLRILFINN